MTYLVCGHAIPSRGLVLCARLYFVSTLELVTKFSMWEGIPPSALRLRQFRATENVSGVTGQIGLSARRFIEVLNNQVELTPKLLCNVRRFQEVLKYLGTRRTWQTDMGRQQYGSGSPRQ